MNVEGKIYISNKQAERFNDNLKLAIKSAVANEREKKKQDPTALFSKQTIQILYDSVKAVFQEIDEQQRNQGATHDLLEGFFETLRFVVKEAALVRSKRKEFSNERAEWFSAFFETLYGLLEKQEDYYSILEVPIFVEKEGFFVYTYNHLTNRYEKEETEGLFFRNVDKENEKEEKIKKEMGVIPKK